MFRFASPEFLFLLLAIPAVVFWYIRQQQNSRGTLRYSNLGIVKTVKKSPLKKYRHVLCGRRILVIILLIVSFARPQSGSTEEEILTEGIDIILAMDISSSMLAEDFKPKNRLEAAKDGAADFVEGH